MAPAKSIASLRRDVACDYLQCVSSTTKFGVAMCIVCVTVGGAFVYYWAFIRGRRERDADNQVNDPHRFSTIANRFEFPSLRHCSPDPEVPAVTRRPAPAVPEPPAVVSQQVPYDFWTAPPMYSSHFFVPGPPPFPPPYASHQQPIFVPAQAAVVLPPPPPFAPSAPPTVVPESPPIVDHGSSHNDERQLVVQVRQPSPGYASTIPDSNSARGQSNPPVGRRTPTDALYRDRSRSSSLSTQSHTQHGQLVVQSGINEPVLERQVHFPETPTATNHSAHRRHKSENTGHENQSRIGRPRFQSVGEPRPATRGFTDGIFGVGDNRVGREHHSKSRSRRRSSRHRPFTALLEGGESYVGRQDQGRGIVGKGAPDQPGRRPSVGEPSGARNPSVGRQDRGRNTPRGRRLGPPPTSRGRSRAPSPSKSGVSSTGALCSFEGSNKDQPSPSPAASSRRHHRPASRSLSTERGLSRPRRILGIPENPPSPSPHSADSQDLYLASVEDNTEEDDNDCHPHHH